jgi:Lrp/AsnC family leucine-responsive transcriptional regulator
MSPKRVHRFVLLHMIHEGEIMAKTSRTQIEKDERQIISLLQENARATIEDMTDKLGFSRQKIWRIIKRLEENRTIWGYSAVVNDEKIKKKRYLMLIKKSMKPMNTLVDKIVELTMQKKGKQINVQIEYSMFLHGEYDWMFMFLASDMKDVKKFTEILTKEYEQVIGNITVIECVFPVQKKGLINPNVSQLKDFFL